LIQVFQLYYIDET